MTTHDALFAEVRVKRDVLQVSEEGHGESL